jgi:predicted transcriptional regulator
VLYHLWKEDGRSQQDLCNATFRDKPSITRLVDNLEKLALVKRVAEAAGPAHQQSLPDRQCKKAAGKQYAFS